MNRNYLKRNLKQSLGLTSKKVQTYVHFIILKNTYNQVNNNNSCFLF